MYPSVESRAEARMVVGEEGAPIVHLPWCVCFFLGSAWLLRDWGLQGGAVNKPGSGLCVSGRVSSTHSGSVLSAGCESLLGAALAQTGSYRARKTRAD